VQLHGGYGFMNEYPDRPHVAGLAGAAHLYEIMKLLIARTL
jgi:alkylation response protein AidB-like acyl-CoA dehydrogenase